MIEMAIEERDHHPPALRKVRHTAVVETDITAYNRTLNDHSKKP